MSRGEKMSWGRKAKARAEKRAAAAAAVQVSVPAAVPSPPRARRSSAGRGAPKSGKRAVRHPANWDQMSRGEKASWTRARNARASGSGRGKKRVTRESARGIHKRVAGERMSHEEAMRRFERIKNEDPKLAELMEQEVEARAARVGAQGSKSKSAVIDGLASGHVPGPGDIVREGSIGGRVLDGSIVVGSALLTVRLDEMIQARPLGLKPSTIKAILEALVLGVAMLKRNRTVTRYAALSAAGTVSGMLVSAAVRRSAPSP